MVSMSKVVLRRHRASPGFSQKPIKVVILTDLAPEINSVPDLPLKPSSKQVPPSAGKRCCKCVFTLRPAARSRIKIRIKTP
ncbi:hypothetical protein D556_0659 [Bordetella holmesii 41130]|uniref:N-acetyltransferase YedL n=1 Tax=Bordetella holmesii 1058 TaxID=1247648 RepID=A0ABP3BJ05_9BORD|nr:hypothetical protein D560_0665 [Bordetella holmesii ATCC 51541]AIT25337.1 hypothetical protein D558_0652 [Bordetella holmesii 44057]EWM45902.1 hypothetical protein D557_3914 [Bordetella holmesii 70147]EWM48437.1 hypothetical protein D556_0659 [Bordetella holmesii 41130]EWM50033.1 hypothetical protein D555_0665 [Bordetella holmesii 35009]EXX95178.1 hypothetical protein D559_2609 [Bordetella holmesii 1058]